MPAAMSFRFTEPHEYQERIRPSEVQITALSRGTFQATLSQLGLQHLTLQNGWQSLPVLARCGVDPSRCSIIFQTATPQPAMRVNGFDVAPDVMVMSTPGEEHFIRSPAGTAWATVTLTPETFAAAGAALAGEDFCAALQTSAIRPAPMAMRRLRTLHQRIATLIPNATTRGMHAETTHAAEQALLAAVVDCLMQEDAVTRPRLGSGNSTVIVRRLHQLLDESEGLPLYLVDVCARLGVSARTLHTACVEHLGLSPHRFLSLRRMHLARQALLAADPRHGTVTEIATRLGFWELGRFSVHYKALFGESPSATLAHPAIRPGHTGIAMGRQGRMI